MSEIFTKKAIGLIHKIYHINLKNKKKYTASTKTKAEVRGGGRKPWKQKGTGQARAGSIRSSIWVGGGVAFGPKPRLVFKKANKKERRLALFYALQLKKKEIIKIPEELVALNSPKTKAFIANFKMFHNFFNNKILLVVEEISLNLKLASKNIPNLTVSSLHNLHLEKLINAKQIYMTEKTFIIFNQIYGKFYL